MKNNKSVWIKLANLMCPAHGDTQTKSLYTPLRKLSKKSSTLQHTRKATTKILEKSKLINRVDTDKLSTPYLSELSLSREFRASGVEMR